MLCFFLPCVPPKVSHHAKRIIRRGKFSSLADTPQLTSARGDLLTLLQPHRPLMPLDGPLFLKLTFTWPWNTSDSKKTRQDGRIWHDVKPDCDNIAKTFIDCMVRCAFLTNDSRIVALKVSKFRGDRSGIEVEMGEA